jgi:GGDEF domain-containing protein
MFAETTTINMKTITIKELKYLAFHDILTGLKNRNYLHKKVNFDKYNFVYFVDINYMHKINRAGHTVGDRHIKKCVKEVSKQLNPSDVFIRYAGDEFIILSKTEIKIKSNKEYVIGKIKKTSDNMFKEIEKADQNMLKLKKQKYGQRRLTSK